MKHQFLIFVDEIISNADKTHALIYNNYTRQNYKYDFDTEDFTKMNAMEAIASVYGFSFTPIMQDDDTPIGFKIEKR